MTIALRQRPLARVVQGIVRAANGTILEVNDMSYLYQDAAGTTPVTAVEQPVGLILDKSQGLMLGPELVSNGTFDTGTNDWASSSGATLSSVSGELQITSTSGVWASSKITTAVGRMYKISAKLKIGTNIAIFLRAGISEGVSTNFTQFTTSSTYTQISGFFIATATTTYISVGGGSAGALTNFADNISVRELYGNHATQSITASRPTLSARKNILLATETLATQSVTTLSAQYTLSFTGTGSITLSGAAAGTLTGTGTDRASLTFTPTAGTLTLTVSGSVTKAQVELGDVAGLYQRVNTATDYDTDPRYFPKYLRFDGVDDYLKLPYMGLYAGGSASVVFSSAISVNSGAGHILSEGNLLSNYPFYALTRIYPGTTNPTSMIRNDAGTDLVNAMLLPATEKVGVRTLTDSGSEVSGYANSKDKLSVSYAREGSTLSLSTTLVGALQWGGLCC